MSVILLVEDNPDNRAIYRTLLEHVGYEVIEAVDGQEALDKARKFQPQAILMDISIPKIDGYEATRILKADESTAGIHIVALTAHARKEDEDRARAVGCDGYLAKPVEPRRVVQEVARFVAPTS